MTEPSQPKGYIHQTLILKCCISSNTLRKNTINVRLPSTNDWDKNLQSILTRIPKKFKFLPNMRQNKWQLSINSSIIDKNNPKLFGDILSTIPPIPVVEIIEKETNIDMSLNCSYVVITHYGNTQFEYIMPKNMDEWDNNTYNDLLSSIKKHFDLNVKFDLFEDISGNAIDIDDIDDIKNGMNDNVEISTY
eukprot:254686_1